MPDSESRFPDQSAAAGKNHALAGKASLRSAYSWTLSGALLCVRFPSLWLVLALGSFLYSHTLAKSQSLFSIPHLFVLPTLLTIALLCVSKAKTNNESPLGLMNAWWRSLDGAGSLGVGILLKRVARFLSPMILFGAVFAGCAFALFWIAAFFGAAGAAILSGGGILSLLLMAKGGSGALMLLLVIVMLVYWLAKIALLGVFMFAIVQIALERKRIGHAVAFAWQIVRRNLLLMFGLSAALLVVNFVFSAAGNFVWSIASSFVVSPVLLSAFYVSYADFFVPESQKQA